MTWDPRARRAPQTIELECSRDPETGVAACSVTYTPWDAATRLSYEDRARTDSRLTVTKADGTESEEVSIARLRLIALSLTVTDATGPLAGFDWSDHDAILAFDEEVYDELLTTALEVQPMPGSRVRAPQDRKAAAAGDEEDPSPAPSSTRPATRARRQD